MLVVKGSQIAANILGYFVVVVQHKAVLEET